MHKSFSLALLFISFLFQVSVFALDDTQVLDQEKVPPSDITLRSFSSCENMDTVLSTYFRKALLDQMSAYGTGGGPFDDRVAMPALEKSIGTGGGGDGASFSQTNVQVAGIDEAEVVKTDGTYIYYASNQADAEGYQYVTITRATPASNMEVIKRIKLPTNYGNIQLYIADKTLTILATKWNQNFSYSPSPITIGQGSSTVVITYDIANPQELKLTRFYTINGDLSQSRRDGDFLYVLSQNYVGLNMWGVAGMYSKEDIKTYLDKKFDAQDILPEIVEIRTDDKNQISIGGKKIPYSLSREKVGCQEVEYLLPEKPQSLSFLTLSIIPLKGGKVTRKVVYGDAAQFFMSQESFYIVSNYWRQSGNFPCPLNARCIMPTFRSEQNSLIHRFSTKNGRVQYRYSILVPGMPLSQYALHEKGSILFSANQRDWTTNGVDIFAIDAQGKLLSKLENIGAKERFQAARYIGDRLYLVTFEQIDPLFVIDTKKPSDMKILGELKMPGYSTYLHPYDDNHIIGIGYDTKTLPGGGVTNAGLKIDLYDVTQVSQPKQKFSHVFGGVGSSSDVLWNPRGLVWDVQRKNLIFPAQLMDQNPLTYQYNSGWQGLLVVNVDATSGIKEEAKISHIDMSGIAEKRKSECAQYVTPAGEEKCYTHIVTGEKICLKPSQNPLNVTIPTYCYVEFDDSSYLANTLWHFAPFFVQRGLYIGNTLYSVSPELLQAHNYGSGYARTKSIANK